MSKKERKRKQYDDDDGRTISSMNVDGMPWYTGRSDDRKAAGMKDTESTPGPEDRGGNSERKEKISLNTKESFALMRGVLSAALLIGVIFFVGLALFILFCIYVWFK